MTNKKGSPKQHVPEIDKAMEAARKAQAEEILHEQVRMERLTVSTMVLQGLVIKGTVGSPEDLADKSIKYADALIRRVTEN
jgi:hypothetical protein